MTPDQQTILMFRGLIASLPEENRVNVKKAEQQIRDVLASYPGGEATIAMGLIGAELQCEGVETITK